MKRKKIFICCAMCAILCIFFFSGTFSRTVSAVTMSSITSDCIKEKEEQIKQALSEKESLQNGLSNLQNIKKDSAQI